MKLLLLTPLLLLPACASTVPKKVKLAVIAQPIRFADADIVRNGEEVREYHFGRYIDPGDPLVMHEGHPVYRVETTAGWNLNPNGGVSKRQQSSRAASSVSANDAVIAEVNKQRVATRVLTEQATTLNARLGEMAQATAQSQEIAKENLVLKRDVAALRDRVNSIDTLIRDRSPSPANTTAPRAEDKW